MAKSSSSLEYQHLRRLQKSQYACTSGIGLKPSWGGMQAIQSFVRQSMAYIPQTPDKETRIELIKTLQTVTEGKVRSITRPFKHCIHCCSKSCVMPVDCAYDGKPAPSDVADRPVLRIRPALHGFTARVPNVYVCRDRTN